MDEAARNLVLSNNDTEKKYADIAQIWHDLRHHLAILEEIAEAGTMDDLRFYIDEFRGRIHHNSKTSYCKNRSANAIINYFVQLAEMADIHVEVRFEMSQDLRITSSEVASLLGNLLENAVEACRRQSSGERHIVLQGGMQPGGRLNFTVENTFETAPEPGLQGVFKSQKHSGDGIGTQSVRVIAAKYNGRVDYSVKDKLFCVSVELEP